MNSPRIIVSCLLLILFIASIPVMSVANNSRGNLDLWKEKFNLSLLEKISSLNDDTVITLLIRLKSIPPSMVSPIRGQHARVVATLKAWAKTTQSKIVPEIRMLRGIVINKFWIDNLLLVKAPLAAFKEIALHSVVVEVLENFKVQLIDKEPALEVSSNGNISSWGIFRIDAPQAWGAGITGEGVRICVLDTGVEAGHPALKDKLLTINTSSPYYPGGWMEFDEYGYPVLSTPHDTDGHGTHTSGIAVGGDTVNILIGVAPGAKLMHGLVLPSGTGSFAQVIAGIEWAVDPYYIDPVTGEKVYTHLPAHIVSMSFGVPGYYGDELFPSIKSMLLANIVPVAAIGNDGANKTDNPGNIWGVYGVGASDENDEIPSWSGGEIVEWPVPPSSWPFFNIYPSIYVKPDFAAPGVNIVSSIPGGSYGVMSGTSMATPYVSGTIALVLEAAGWTRFNEPDTPEKVYLILNSTSTDLAQPGQDTRYGWGIINAYLAVTKALEISGSTGIEGYVYDSIDQSPVKWAMVTVLETNTSTYVNGSGYFRLSLEPGTYHLEITAWGYKPKNITVNVTGINESWISPLIHRTVYEPSRVGLRTIVKTKNTGSLVLSDTNDYFKPSYYAHVIVYLGRKPYGIIMGRIIGSDGLPVEKAEIRVLNTPVVKYSGLTGNFSLWLPAGNYTLAVASPGYSGREINLYLKANQTLNIGDIVLKRIPRIAILYDYLGEIKGLIENNIGWYAVDYGDIGELISDLRTGFYDALVYSGHYYALMPTSKQLFSLIEILDSNGIGAVFLDQWDQSSQYTDLYGYGIRALHTYLNDPPTRSTGSINGSIYLKITQKHPVFLGYKVGDIVELMRNTQPLGTEYSYFRSFSGKKIGELVANNTIMGDLVAWKITGNGSRWLLLSSFAPEEYQDTRFWSIDAFNIFLNGLTWVAAENVSLYIENTSLHVGDKAVLHISNAPPNTLFEILLDEKLIGNVTTSEEGTADFLFEVPLVTGGKHVIEAVSADKAYYGSTEFYVIPKINVYPQLLIVPGIVDIEVTGLHVFQEVMIYIDGNTLSHIRANSSGSFSIRVNLPLLASGKHILYIVDSDNYTSITECSIYTISELDLMNKTTYEKLEKLLNITQANNELLGEVVGILQDISNNTAIIRTETGIIRSDIRSLNISLNRLLLVNNEIMVLLNTSRGLVLARLKEVSAIINELEKTTQKLQSDLSMLNKTLAEITKLLSRSENDILDLEEKTSSMEAIVDEMRQNITVANKRIEESSRSVMFSYIIGGIGILIGLMSIGISLTRRRIA